MATSEAALVAILDAKRDRYPELRRPLTWPVLQRVARAEGLLLRHGPLPPDADAALVMLGDRGCIVLNATLPPRRHTYRAAHELGHWWLHRDSERCIYLMSDSHDPREDEAEALATRLMQGW